MVVIILESVQTSVRGELTRWLLELHAGVFVGNISAMVRDKLWDMLCSKMKNKGGGFLIHSTNTEQGYAIYSTGATTKALEDFDGLLLVRTKQPKSIDPLSASVGK
ncbi:MAG TPA: type I-E CRISPR-associated endoribonuclease Cas2e [Pyrinomonadaceae bacterium]|jgi:CRISPR-associated protein Cas2|nr:type I-E CRISPR-associated endoribonuclease Cas2e [Pyrinomonadaceae bacterium]